MDGDAWDALLAVPLLLDGHEPPMQWFVRHASALPKLPAAWAACSNAAVLRRVAQRSGSWVRTFCEICRHASAPVHAHCSGCADLIRVSIPALSKDILLEWLRERGML